MASAAGRIRERPRSWSFRARISIAKANPLDKGGGGNDVEGTKLSCKRTGKVSQETHKVFNKTGAHSGGMTEECNRNEE